MYVQHQPKDEERNTKHWESIHNDLKNVSSNSSPAVPLFSGWNWVASWVSFAMADTNGWP